MGKPEGKVTRASWEGAPVDAMFGWNGIWVRGTPISVITFFPLGITSFVCCQSQRDSEAVVVLLCIAWKEIYRRKTQQDVYLFWFPVIRSEVVAQASLEFTR